MEQGRGFIGALAAVLTGVMLACAALAPAGLVPRAAAATTFFDSFDGPAGAPGYPWLTTDATPGTTSCVNFMRGSCPARGNVFKDGFSHLVLRARRDGTRFRGAMAGTFVYTDAWPPSSRTMSWHAPFTMSMRARMTGAPGLWNGAWWQSVNQTAAKGLFELDQTEERTFEQKVHNTYAHFYQNRTKVLRMDYSCHLGLTTPLTDYHLYKMVVASASVSYSVDNRLCGTQTNLTVPAGSTPFSQHAFGLLLQNFVGEPGSWASGGFQPSGSGPWDMVVDYVAVTQN